MKWQDFLQLVGDEPVIDSSILRIRGISAQSLRLQLVRWVEAGRLVRLRRGVYMPAAPFRKIEPHPFLIANRLRKASYVSLQSALAYRGMIPESVPAVTSVTTGRPERLSTPAGLFIFRHIKKGLFQGFHAVEVARSQTAFVARPEKALLDLIHLTPGADSAAYLKELRLENLETLDRPYLRETARTSGSPKLVRAVRRLDETAGADETEGP